ncbi:MAG: DUF3667 domain-containing protein [Gammaproteobacteria bacterium]|nr:DUF3667 domain-containing protein [Gammaproteobacteria bacterium]
MTNLAGPLYETTFLVPSEHAAEFSAWLQELLGESLRQPGIVDVKTWDADAGEDMAARICQFRCRDDNAIDELLDTYFAGIDVAVAEVFGDTVDVSSRCLRQDDSRDVAVSGSPDCLNCGSRLSGQYCGSCGQRAQSRLISLWQLVAEAFGDLFELDSRLWRTIIPLLARPGQLTQDYLLGRRARYMPPFRSYLVLSVIFFVVAFFDPREDLGLLFEPVPEQTTEQAAAADSEVSGAPADEDDGFRVKIAEGDAEIDENCDVTDDSITGLPDWFKRRMTPERLQQVCERIVADKGATFVDLLLDNIPVALIVLLPLMALVLKILYPLSRRYFVEHLLFFVHFHAFFFLILTLQILFSRIAALLSLPEMLRGLTLVAASFYIPVYLYKAMRRVYGQRSILTFLKYVTLVAAYGLGMSLTMFGAALFALVAV